MNVSSLAALALLYLLAPSKAPTPSPSPPPKKKGKKEPAKDAPPPEAPELLLLGDSQSVGPTSPGGRLAKKLTAAGHPCRVLAKGGKTAQYFVKGPGGALLAAELGRKPKTVLSFFGSNELANIAAFPKKDGSLNPKLVKAQANGHTRLKAILDKAGVRALFVGPPKFGAKVKSEAGGRPLNDAGPELIPVLTKIYGEDNFLNARPLTPEHTGVHFFGTGEASAFAANLLPAILAAL